MARLSYQRDPGTEARLRDIATMLDMSHIELSNLRCIRSTGSNARSTLARIHVLPKALQEGIGIGPHYVVELIEENFSRLSPEEQTKTMIHELMHIPKSFGGGFVHHGNGVNRRNVERMYNRYKSL